MSATPDSTLADPQQIIADLQRQLAECQAERDKAQRNLSKTKTERDEAQARETALAEVLDAINHSSGDVTAVFEAILEKAHRFCGAEVGTLAAYDGEHFHALATIGYPEQFAAFVRQPFRPNIYMQRLVDGERVVYLPDQRTLESQPDSEATRAFFELTDLRTTLFVALRKDGGLLGFISAHRHGVRPFSEKEIALLETFAAQAVIAMENARLITETREALEQQTATAEVLQVINSSPGNLAPVFDAMLEKAMRLCEAAFGMMVGYDGEQFPTIAVRGLPPAAADFLQKPLPAVGSLAELVRGENVIHIPDARETETYRLGIPGRRALVDLAGARTALWVALRKEQALLGTFIIYRQEVRPFSENQIALLENFAAQAVIAMENARLLTETREALEQQTATAAVLEVINSSPGDLAPVFDTLVETAGRLCGTDIVGLAIRNDDAYRYVAHRALDPAWQAYVSGLSFTPGRGTITGRTLLERRVMHVADLAADPEHTVPEIVTLGGLRTFLGVPLLREGEPIGVISLARQRVEPFTERQIELVRTFADQAVIAMENTRLIAETREALEQQTATAEVLQVINSSPGDLAPVFDAILEKAHSLCGAVSGHLMTWDGECFETMAIHGGMGGIPIGISLRPKTGFILDRVARGETVIHVTDVFADPAYHASPYFREVVEIGRVRTMLYVALRKEDALLGVIGIYNRAERPFTDKQIALLQNFAAQAVIAMENARLLTETREALDQQTATAEVLQVINSSPGDLVPVFDSMLERAMRLCGAAFGQFHSFDGERFHTAALLGMPPRYAEYRGQTEPSYGPGTGPARILGGERVVHVADMADSEAYRSGDAARRALVDLGGCRTLLCVGLCRDERLLGAVSLYRQEVRLFSDKQIALLENFAAQAVIAMENARLLTETREALEQQTATAEVLQVINSSPGDLAPVFQAMLQKAHTLCEASFGALMTHDGERFYPVAHQGTPAPFREFLASGIRPGRGDPFERIVEGTAFSHIHDLSEVAARYPDEPLPSAAVDLGGIRSLLVVPLRKDSALLGVITAYRQEVRPFTEKQIALLQNFAAQAVIAMENARLLDEIRQRQAELRVTFDNMVDGVVMFDEALHLAAWNRNFQELLQLPEEFLAERCGFDEYIRYLAQRGEFGETDAESQIARLRARIGDHYGFERTRPDGTVIEVRHNPMPGGGIVLIYSDITERKRSEVEIRAARDAAEAAYRDLKAAQASLIQAEKMASLGQLTAGIAHEIKNPLNFVNNFAGLSVELLDELKQAAAPAIAGLDDDQRGEVDEIVAMLTGNLEKIAEHGRRADNIVKSMLEHSRGGSGERREVDLNNLVEGALNLAYHGARAQDPSFNITLEREFDPALAPIELAPQEMTRVFLNLFGNGFYAAAKRQRESGDPNFQPTLEVSTHGLGDAVEVSVRDNGAGIPPELRDKLFQPFFTTKPTGEGTGLGLSISYDIVTQQHGGMIEVDSRVGEFTEFTVRLPRSLRRAMTEAAS